MKFKVNDVCVKKGYKSKRNWNLDKIFVITEVMISGIVWTQIDDSDSRYWYYESELVKIGKL